MWKFTVIVQEIEGNLVGVGQVIEHLRHPQEQMDVHGGRRRGRDGAEAMNENDAGRRVRRERRKQYLEQAWNRDRQKAEHKHGKRCTYKNCLICSMETVF